MIFRSKIYPVVNFFTMDTPFNFEQNRRDGKESDRMKGKNMIENQEHARESVENTDQDIRVLYEAALDKVGGDRPQQYLENPENTEQYADSNPLTLQRYYLLQLLQKTPEFATEEIDDIPSHRKQQVKRFLRAVISDDVLFPLDNTDLIDIEGKDAVSPLRDISDLYTAIKISFPRDFLFDVSTLDLIPERITVTDTGVIINANFEFDTALDEQSVKFRDKFPEADTFIFSYHYDPDHKPNHNLYLTGYNSQDTEGKTVRIDYPGSAA